jgi:general secretion pathway protein G
MLMLVWSCSRSQPAPAAKMSQDLAAMRKALHDYRRDKGQPPHALSDLVTGRYLPAIPNDPVTRAADWRVITEAPVRIDDFSSAPAPAATSGIVDVHSNAPGTDANGKRWSEY